MALQNRVLPDGRIVADPARGLFTGNRGGAIHDVASRTLLPRRRWASKAWITCVTRFRGRHRTIMGPGYTHLFFLDEVTALAAGHRPCYECRRADALRFAEAWRRGHGLDKTPRAGEMDIVLHAERHAVTGQPYEAELSDLPDGAIVGITGSSAVQEWRAIRGACLLAWSLAGYHAPMVRPRTGSVVLVTPPSIVRVLEAGYRPVWHQTAL
ncbi:MAG: hypothetical protein AAGL24_10640 [Pseudomonadota bacterium]